MKLLLICAVTAVAVVIAVLTAPELVLQKLFGRLMMPLGMLCTVMWLLSALAFYQRARRWGVIMLLLAGGLTLAGNPLIARWLLRGLEAQVPEAASGQDFDVICVLGGGTQCSETGTPSLAYHGDRVALGARLFHGGHTPLLLASGSGITDLDDGRDLAAETARLWQGLGVPSSAIRQLPGPRTTSEELAAYHNEVAREHWQRVGLVSSAWHLPRALKTCERLGLHVIPLPAGRHGPALPWSIVYIVPTGEAAYEIQTVLWERMGMLLGR